MDLEIEIMLNSNDVERLCEVFHLYDFQVKIIKGVYDKVKDVEILKNGLIDRIKNGYYSKPEQIVFMASNYCKNAIIHSKDNGFEFLTTKCKLRDNDALLLINSVLKANQSLNEMLSDELDVSNINIRVNDMMNEIIPAFLDSYNENTKEM